MSEYIDKQKTLSTLENTAKYYKMPYADEWTRGIHYGLIHGVDNIVDNVPVEDVVERKQIDEAFEDLEAFKEAVAETNDLYAQSCVQYCIEIVKHHIGG